MTQAAINMKKKEIMHSQPLEEAHSQPLEDAAKTEADISNLIHAKAVEDIPKLVRQDAIKISKTKLPKYQCLSKKDLAPLTFTEWMRSENHIYIGNNKAKYTKNRDAVTEWCCQWLERSLFYGNISRDEYFEEYERFIRDKKWDDLDNLFNKTLGCWCPQQNSCHFKIIYQLCKEKLLERRMKELC